jgi:hypothetical protein
MKQDTPNAQKIVDGLFNDVMGDSHTTYAITRRMNHHVCELLSIRNEIHESGDDEMSARLFSRITKLSLDISVLMMALDPNI